MDELIDLRGKLLIASSAILDGNFNRSVVLIVDHDSRGSLGVVLNHPLPSDRSRRHPLYKGGPVDPDHRSILHSSPALASSEAIVDGVFFESSDDLLADLADDSLTYRRFAGYAGWSAGQLEGELLGGSWIVAETRRDDLGGDDLFGANPGDLWRSVLRRQPRPISQMALYPDDVIVN